MDLPFAWSFTSICPFAMTCRSCRFSRQCLAFSSGNAKDLPVEELWHVDNSHQLYGEPYYAIICYYVIIQIRDSDWSNHDVFIIVYICVISSDSVQSVQSQVRIFMNATIPFGAGAAMPHPMHLHGHKVRPCAPGHGHHMASWARAGSGLSYCARWRSWPWASGTSRMMRASWIPRTQFTRTLWTFDLTTFEYIRVRLYRETGTSGFDSFDMFGSLSVAVGSKMFEVSCS